jgi:molybdate transport system substrate-binding protein
MSPSGEQTGEKLKEFRRKANYLYNLSLQIKPHMNGSVFLNWKPVVSSVFLLSLVLALALGALPIHAVDRELSIAAAADLSAALTQIAAEYEQKTGVAVKLSFGASGALTQQIENGAPFDLFFAADMGYPQRLIAEDKADRASLYRYAIGQLVLWTSSQRLDFEGRGMNVLLDPSVKKIAIANPQHAPYGRAAVAALKHYGLYEKVTDRLVLGENVAQAAEFAESGNAQIGFVALAFVLAPAMQGKGKYWKVPSGSYPPLDQGALVISDSGHKQDALAFLEYVERTEVKRVLERYGFNTLDAR